jgi:hypothetical protein
MPRPAIPQLKRQKSFFAPGEKPPQKPVGCLNIIIIVSFGRGRNFLRGHSLLGGCNSVRGGGILRVWRRRRTIFLMITTTAIPLMVRGRLLVAA